ncbi:MAG: hypothetical protein E4H29_02525, partial [Deltaproteobacteria bacterium]
LILKLLGQSINTMTLGGMAIAIGVLVDDAIIYGENVFRRIRQSGASGPAPPRLSVPSATCSGCGAGT